MSVTNLLLWRKCYRDIPFCDDGLLSTFLQLAFAAAYQDGKTKYYKYENEVKQNQVVGGIVGLKSICGTKNKEKLLKNLETLKDLSLIDYEIDKSRKIIVTVKHLRHFDSQNTAKSCRATQGYGFVCIDSCVPDMFIGHEYQFSENDALIDLWFHTTFGDHFNIFSYLYPCIEYDQKPIVTLDLLAERWNWTKSKTSRFFKKHSEKFSLIKLPCSCGSLITNNIFPVDKKVTKPSEKQVFDICKKIKSFEKQKVCITKEKITENDRINKLIKKYTQTIISEILSEKGNNKTDNIAKTKKRIRTFIKNKLYSLQHPSQLLICSGFSEHFNYRKLLYSLKINEITNVRNLHLQKTFDGFRLLNHQNVTPEIITAIEKLVPDTVEILYCGNYYHLINCPI